MNRLLLCLICCLGSCSFAAVKISDFGAGPMLKPAATYYVSLSGKDSNDGKTLQTAWRDLHRACSRLRAGDTLLIAGGTYFLKNQIAINVKDDSLQYRLQCGRPGSPIRIMGMPGEKVVLDGALFVPDQKPGGRISEFRLQKAPYADAVLEYPSMIELQRVDFEQLAWEYPGTYFYDAGTKRLVVHYAALNHSGVKVGVSRVAIRIHGSYVHLENLDFVNFSNPIYMRQNRPYDKNIAEHNTVKGCGFYYNYFAGVTNDEATRTLIIGNRGYGNTERGSCHVMGKSRDVLVTGNWFGPCPHSQRQEGDYSYNYAVGHYAIQTDLGSGFHVIGNYLENGLAFRLKPGVPDSVFEDNILTGSFWAESRPVKAVYRNNYFGGPVGWSGIGWNLKESDFQAYPMHFSGNVRDRREFRSVNPMLAQAEKLREKLPSVEFPAVVFQNLRAEHIDARTAAILWTTPCNDGWGRVEYRRKGNPYTLKKAEGRIQGVRHFVGITGLRPGTEYEYRAFFRGRRGESGQSEMKIFRTAAVPRKPGLLEVGPGKLTLEAAACMAIPGDVISLMPGRHTGQFVPMNSGQPGKPITLKGNGAIIDGLKFYTDFISLQDKEHFIIDGIQFTGLEETTRKAAVNIRGGGNIIVRNCRFGIDKAIDYTAGAFVSTRNTDRLLIENNISWGGDYPVSVVGGKGHRILRNTVADATMFSLNLWSVEDIEVSGNIFYRPCCESKVNTAVVLSNAKGRYVLRDNVYWSPFSHQPAGGTLRTDAGKVLFKSRTLAEWQKHTGQDKGSLQTDPMFVDAPAGNFNLKKNSPAKGKGANLKWK